MCRRFLVSGPYLFIAPLCCSCDCVMAFMLVHHAHIADKTVISTTKHIKGLVMMRANPFLELTSGIDYCVISPPVKIIVNLKVCFTV